MVQIYKQTHPIRPVRAPWAEWPRKASESSFRAPPLRGEHHELLHWRVNRIAPLVIRS